jgi:uncharacterized protein YraI
MTTDTIITNTLGKTVNRRFLVKSMAGISAAAVAAATVGRAAANHTAQLYTVSSNANFRSGPGTGHAIIAVVVKGATFQINGQVQNGYAGIIYKGTTGWVLASLVVAAGGQTSPDPVIVGTAKTNSSVNLRSGPSTGNSVLRVVPAGSVVQISNTVQNGFRYVIHNGLAGWIADQYLGAGPSQPSGETFRTTANLNLRAEPSSSAKVLLVMPSGATVKALAGVASGWRQVSYNGTVGWAATSYLN